MHKLQLYFVDLNFVLHFKQVLEKSCLEFVYVSGSIGVQKLLFSLFELGYIILYTINTIYVYLKNYWDCFCLIPSIVIISSVLAISR